MRTFFLPPVLAMLLIWGVPNQTEAASVDVQTTVYRLMAGGALAELDFTRPVPRRDLMARESDQVDRKSPKVLNPIASAGIGTPQLTATSSESPVTVNELEPVTALPEPNQVALGDVLRYELIVHNGTQFTIPTLALQIREHLAFGAELSAASSLGNADWHFEAVAVASSNFPSGFDGSDELALVGPRTFTLTNLKPLIAGERRRFAYDVVVKQLVLRGVSGTEEPF